MIATGRALAAVAATALLCVGGCGGGDGTPRPGRVPGQSSLGVEVVGILTGTAAGGRTTSTALELSSASDVDRLLEEVGADLARQVRATVSRTDVPTGRRLVGQVVDVGCGSPDGVRAVTRDGATALEPTYRRKPPEECFAPVTSVALVLLDAR